jgi:hypothetical protein
MSDPDSPPAQASDSDGLRADEIDRFEVEAARRSVGLDQDLMPEQLCWAAVDSLGVDGAAISVYLGGDVAVPVGANDRHAAMAEALQFTVRQGPCLESYGTRRPVLIPDLHDQESAAWAQWPIYAAQLVHHTPFRGVFAYPLLDSGIVLGSLGLYRRKALPLQSLGSAEVIAARIAERLATELFTRTNGEPVQRWLDSPPALRRRLVWQAQGLTAQANSITPGQAIDLLRAQAYTADRSLDDLAADVLSGRLPVPDLSSDH